MTSNPFRPKTDNNLSSLDLAIDFVADRPNVTKIIVIGLLGSLLITIYNILT